MNRARWVALISVLVLVAGAVAGGVLLSRDGSTRVRAEFSAAVGLYAGSDVRVLGVSVGHVVSVTPKGEQVLVEMELDPGRKVAASTGAAVLAPSLVSDRFVQLTEPWVSGPALADGDVIPETRTEVPVELDQVYQGLDDITLALGPDGANRDGALSDLLTTGAKNLEGNGKAINRVLREFGAATGTLSNSDDDLFRTVDNLDRFNQVLVENDDAVGQVNAQLATVSQYLADDRGDLAAAIQTLGSSLERVQVFVHDNRGQLRSSVRKLKSTTKVLHRQRKALAEVLKTLPVALQGFLGAYDPATGRLDGRTDLNELSIWDTSVGGQVESGSSAQQAPPLLLPSVGEQR